MEKYEEGMDEILSARILELIAFPLRNFNEKRKFCCTALIIDKAKWTVDENWVYLRFILEWTNLGFDW